MAKYEISHPELPQVRGILELKDGEEPSDQHFWEAAKTMVRPYGASQLSNEAKISAYRNGFFDTPSGPILDVDDDPETIQDEESPGLLSTLVDYAQDMGRKADPFISPYRKVLSLKDEAVPYENTENLDQFREAGKILFGLLDNREMSIQGDPISEALKQTGMPFYQKNKDARGRVKAAAMDYASDNIKSSVGMGTARAWKTPEFLLRGGAALSNYLTLDEEDDGEVLSYVNSLIGFDKVNYEYETAAEFAAWVMDNPVDALKATVGVEPESMTFDSQLEQDLRSGFQVPSEGIGLAFEVVGDPLNAAGGTLAKGVTAPMRIGLKGRMLKTIQDVQQKTIQLAKYQNTLQKLPTDIANKSLQALIRSRITKESAKLADELAEQQKVLQKYGSNSLHLRLMGKASPETLGKVAMETFDQSTDAGKMGMGLVQEATKATDKMSKLRRVANTAAKLNPEIAGASVGALVAGPIGAAVGASLPTIAKIGRFLSSMTENSAIRYIINSERQAGREVTIESARQRYKNFKNLSGTALGLGSAAGFSFDQDALGGGAAVAALATFIGPKALSLYDNIARDARVVGSELTLARTGDHTPFFRRLSMLPTPDQGLAGATMDKFNILMKPSPEGLASRVKDAIAQGSRASAKEVNPSAQPFRVGPGGEKIGQAPTISNATQKVANFLDNAGAVGRLGTPLETLGRFGKGMAAGASLPATIGFVASAGQPSGAVAGAIMSAPFTALGAGAGMYENYKTKGDLYSKQIGDIQYYREHLTKSEQAEFDAMPAHIRTQIAGYSLSHPDVVFKQTTKGEGEFDPITMEVSYNPNGSGYLKGTLAHELTHFMEVHGLTPMVNRILFGDKETKTAGEFASYDKDGNVIYTDEFIELRDIYMDRLRKDASLDPEAVADYEANPQKIGREIFADQGADFLLTGKREKALNQGPAGKAIQATIDGITGVSFLRDFLLKLNQPLNADGKFITSTDLFKGKLRKIPELQNLIEKYYKDVRGLKKAEIEGSEFTDPNTGKTRKTEGKKPIDDEFETLYTVEDQKNPNVVDKLNTGGIYKTDPQTGEVQRDALGNPIRMTKGEADKVSEAAGDHAADVLRKNGIDVETNDKNRPFVKDLPALSEAVIDQLAKGPIHPRQIAALREISRALRQGDGERAGILIGYYAATQGRKPKAVPFALRTTMPYGFELTAQGNIMVRIHDVDQIQKNLQFLKGERQPKKLPDDLIGMYDELFGNDNAVWDAFSLYRQNTANGIDGRTGLDADPVIANKKLNFLNALHGGITKSQVAMNPVLNSIGYNMAAINKKPNPFGPATKTFRLDRVFNAERSGKASPVNEQRVVNLMSPEAQKLYTPKAEADVTVTDKLFMPASEAGATKGKVAEAAKLWNEKGIDSPYFKKWFGKSKVVDENGEPLVVKHGGASDIDIFNTEASTAKKSKYQAMYGAHFTADTNLAKNYDQGGFYEVYLNLENPLDLTSIETIPDPLIKSLPKKAKTSLNKRIKQAKAFVPETSDNGSMFMLETALDALAPAEARKWAESNGFDGVKYTAVITGGSQAMPVGMHSRKEAYIAFSPEQIKSATGNRGTFDAGERNILFMPASEAKNPKSGDMLTLDDKSLKLFLPSPSNPNASLSDFKGKNVQVLTADLSVVGDKKADGAMISFTGGPGYLSVNDAWGFTNEAGAKAFKTRWERDGKPLIGITSMKQENHRASTLTREYYVRKFMEAINGGKISENTVNRHIKTALKRAIDGKNGLTNKQKEALKTVKTIEDFLKVFPDKELIPWKATPMIYGKLDAKTLPIKQDRLKKLGLDTDTILRETRQPEYNDIKKGSLLAIAEYDGSGATYRPDLNSAYPWSIPLNEKAFLKDFADIQDLSSRPDLRGSDGEANMAVAMGAGVMLDKLGRGDVNFMPSDPKAPTRQPANRIQQQAPSMPGNRFMAPAASAGSKLSERFR